MGGGWGVMLISAEMFGVLLKYRIFFWGMADLGPIGSAAFDPHLNFCSGLYVRIYKIRKFGNLIKSTPSEILNPLY